MEEELLKKYDEKFKISLDNNKMKKSTGGNPKMPVPLNQTEEENWGKEGVDWEWDEEEKKDDPFREEEVKKEAVNKIQWGEEGVDWYWSGESEEEEKENIQPSTEANSSHG